MLAFLEVLTGLVWELSVNFITNYKYVTYNVSDLIQISRNIISFKTQSRITKHAHEFPI